MIYRIKLDTNLSKIDLEKGAKKGRIRHILDHKSFKLKDRAEG